MVKFGDYKTISETSMFSCFTLKANINQKLNKVTVACVSLG